MRYIYTTKKVMDEFKNLSKETEGLCNTYGYNMYSNGICKSAFVIGLTCVTVCSVIIGVQTARDISNTINYYSSLKES